MPSMDQLTIGPDGMPKISAKPQAQTIPAAVKPAEKQASPGKKINPETGEIVKIEEVKSYLTSNNISDLSVDILCTMIINEDFNLNILVQKIAESGQTIKIQYTNVAYGNTEFEINT